MEFTKQEIKRYEKEGINMYSFLKVQELLEKTGMTKLKGEINNLLNLYDKMGETKNNMKMKIKTYIIDIDNTICSQEKDYSKAKPFLNIIKKINKLYDEGNIIKFFTARGTETGIDWRLITEKQLKDWGVKYHELIMGKPAGDIYVDDRSIKKL